MTAIIDENTVLTGGDEVRADIVINRPKALNALNVDVLQGLILALEKVQKQESLRVITITGAGTKAFVAGADIAWMADLGPRAIADYVELGQRAMRAIERARVPVVAVVNGYALGGGLELAMACDVIIASDKAKLGQPEVKLGIIPGFGGTQRLVQRTGIGTARRLIYSGEMIEAEEALRLGLVDKVVSAEELQEGATAFCNEIINKAPLAVQQAKRLLRESSEQFLLSGLQREVETFLDLFQTADREEGMQAFMEKREAKFTGK
ncbi:MAG: crotonase [Candidatus Dadabacteria bacterium]|nr:MAG: crotonase [Candidatus Dadabacteria bacterium]